ncbi:hypothetical protein K491DRAFT_675252 [Lophiostoma macrostomum CBS 122681]|uniref:Uncharacterized protein n=1 Tax=Lophiostoma macrostomum CBS 122681 TaxID=1314788 RepID=A0A6A6TIL7_9PLEO|nr:hypothetical protein K491DRAFT_675252 [Lophiostoma macrostomum CBS 122681]
MHPRDEKWLYRAIQLDQKTWKTRSFPASRIFAFRLVCRQMTSETAELNEQSYLHNVFVFNDRSELSYFVATLPMGCDSLIRKIYIPFLIKHTVTDGWTNNPIRNMLPNSGPMIVVPERRGSQSRILWRLAEITSTMYEGIKVKYRSKAKVLQILNSLITYYAPSVEIQGFQGALHTIENFQRFTTHERPPGASVTQHPSCSQFCARNLIRTVNMTSGAVTNMQITALNTTCSRLLQIPQELRNEIYKHVLSGYVISVELKSRATHEDYTTTKLHLCLASVPTALDTLSGASQNPDYRPLVSAMFDFRHTCSQIANETADMEHYALMAYRRNVFSFKRPEPLFEFAAQLTRVQRTAITDIFLPEIKELYTGEYVRALHSAAGTRARSSRSGLPEPFRPIREFFPSLKRMYVAPCEEDKFMDTEHKDYLMGWPYMAEYLGLGSSSGAALEIRFLDLYSTSDWSGGDVHMVMPSEE